jgi:hypothetical protein
MFRELLSFALFSGFIALLILVIIGRRRSNPWKPATLNSSFSWPERNKIESKIRIESPYKSIDWSFLLYKFNDSKKVTPTYLDYRKVLMGKYPSILELFPLKLARKRVLDFCTNFNPLQSSFDRYKKYMEIRNSCMKMYMMVLNMESTHKSYYMDFIMGNNLLVERLTELDPKFNYYQSKSVIDIKLFPAFKEELMKIPVFGPYIMAYKRLPTFDEYSKYWLAHNKDI